MSEYNRHKWAMEWMNGGGRDPNGRSLDDEIRIGKEDWLKSQQVAAGGRIGFESGQLVQPGPGRQGYNGKYEDTTQYKKTQEAQEKGLTYDRETKRFRKKILTPQTQLSPENLKKWNTFQKSADFRKLVKDNKNLSKWDLLDIFSRKLSRKDKVIGIKGLVESLGADNPYSYNTIHNTYALSLKKITKNMSNEEKAIIKSSQKIWNIIDETLGKPTTDWAVRRPAGSYILTGEKAHKMWSINKSQIKKLNKALNKNKVRSITPNTIKNVYKLLEDEDLMKALDAYKGGKIDESHPILKAILKGEQTGARIHAFTALGEALRGDIELEGISKNLKRGNRIINSLHGNYGGPLGTQLLQWAKRRMAKDFDNPQNTYNSLVKSMRTALNDAGLNHLAVDEIFPARTGQITIGKGSGAYNQIIQFIDQDINEKEKKYFDARAGKRYKAIIAARKDKNWERVNKFVEAHQKDIDNFYEVNPQAKGKVKLTQLDYNPKTHTFASPTEIYGKDVLPSKIQKDIDKFYRKTGLSLDVGSARTLEKSASDVKTLTESKAWRNSIKSGKAKMLAKTLELAGIPICSSQSAKASGGRIGFAEQVCGVKFAEQNEDAFMKKAGQSEDAAKLFKSGQIGRFLKGAKSWTLANMGPAGWIGGEILIMGLGTLYEVSQGKGWKEGLDTWTGLGGHFGKAEDRLKEIGKEQGWNEQQIYDALKTEKLLELSHTGQQKEAELAELLARQEIGGTARFKSSDIPSVTQNITGALYDEEPSYPKYSDRKHPGAYKPTQGQYQDPKYLRNLKEEIAGIWDEGDALYKSLMNPQTSFALHQELRDRKKYEELVEKKKIWEWTKKRPGIGQQVEGPDPSELDPFELSPGHPGYTGAFIKWKPDFYAEGGIADLLKK